MKITGEDKNKWNDILCSWIREANIIKMSILLKLPILPIELLQFLSKLQWHFSQK